MDKKQPESQKEAVFRITIEEINEEGRKCIPNSRVYQLLTPYIKRRVRARFLEGIKKGEIFCGKDLDDPKLKYHCTNIIADWYNRDPRYQGVVPSP